jgi:hypothetical protein
MKIAHLELLNSADIETIQNWLDTHSVDIIHTIQIEGFDVYILYTEIE